MDVLEYLDTKNFEYKRSGNEAIIVCPYCNRDKLSVNIHSGMYQCWHCQAEEPNSPYQSGHITYLQKLWGDVLAIKTLTENLPQTPKVEIDFTEVVELYHTKLWEQKAAIGYLIKRGITKESISRFKLGFMRQYNQNWLVIPSYEKGIPKLMKLRKLPPDENTQLDKYIREKGGKSILFNADAIDKYDDLIIAEGEIDAISLIQLGYENVVASTAGAKTLLTDWYDQLILKNKIYICFDNDAPGQAAAKEIWATRLGIKKCWNVLLPEGEDVNSFLKNYQPEEFSKVLANASQYTVEGLMSLNDVLYEMFRRANDPDLTQFFPTPWENLNKLLGGGLVKKRLVVLGGRPGVGKTSFTIQLCYHVAKFFQLPTLIFCLEMPEISLATKIIQLERDITIGEINPHDAMIYANELGELPIYFGYSSRITMELLYNTVKAARDRLGIGLFVFDNLQLLVRTGEEADMGNASKMFKDMAMDLNIIVTLISQPRKLNNEEAPTYDSLKGSSAIGADGDEIIIMHRKRLTTDNQDSYTALESNTRIIVDKDRFSTGGTVFLEFIGEKSKFIEKER